MTTKQEQSAVVVGCGTVRPIVSAQKIVDSIKDQQPVSQEPEAWQEVVSNVANNLGEMAAQAHTQRFCDEINAEVDKLFALVAIPVEPVINEHIGEINQFGVFVSTLEFRSLPIGTKFYAAPVRTKDLTDEEIMKVTKGIDPENYTLGCARAVIAADREKNK